ncbi:hypothetical protein Patl1_20526 [Pistacia atlantica]|uniref:Uncharacterized protein n=1 Tax=Pistacia atlantica TaxID=434234 RepID=A0ACC1BLM3_9ROSI|nr:hypothetical protein Patl1_20526 [Pistacia atlantica]
MTSMQVSSATTTFAMSFSSSMSIVEYYLPKCFPVPYAYYEKFFLGSVSLIIFILAFTIFGGVGISNMIEKIEAHDYMRFENLCTYGA